MASGKVADFFCGLTYKALNLTILFIFTDLPMDYVQLQ
jgi:hypothetical protein